MSLIDLRKGADRAIGNADPSLAFNLSPMTDSSTQTPFIDITHNMRPFFGHLEGRSWGGMTNDQLEAGGYLDADGYPKVIPEGVSAIGTIWAWKDQGGAFESRAGTYVLTYEGEGSIRIGNAEVLSSEPGRIVFRDAGDGFDLRITETDPRGNGEYLRGLSIVKEEYVDLHAAGALFNPEWLEVVGNSRQFRFMDWMQTNESKVVEWDDRPKPGDASWMTGGVPVEIMVQLANEAGVDPWFCMPHNASEEYIRNFATYVRDHLDPNLKATVEFSNEVWNPLFTHYHDLFKEAKAEFGDLKDGEYWSYLTKRATGVMEIWTEVFGAETEDRLIRTLGTQGRNPWVLEQLLEAEIWRAQAKVEGTRVPDIGEFFDSVNIATYFGGKVSKVEEDRNALIAAINDPNVDEYKFLYDYMMDPDQPGSLPDNVAIYIRNAELAQKYGLDLIAYEGGQHVHHIVGISKEALQIESFLMDFVRSDYMADLYEELWDAWKEIGDGPFMQFGDVGFPTKFGSWGLFSFLGDVNPRAELLQALNESQAAWWESRGGAHFQNGVITTGTAASETLTGTSQEDYLTGAAGDDTLVGGEGDDGLHGGAGVDTLLLSGRQREYTLVAEGDGYRLDGPDGSDFLIGIETLLFTDGSTISVAQFLETGGGDTLRGTAANDSLSAGVRGVLVDGAAGIDTFNVEGSTPTSGTLAEGVTALTTGITVGAVNSQSALARELGVGAVGSQAAYTVYLNGSSAVIGGSQVRPGYFSLNENRAVAGGGLLSDTALDTALALSTVLVNVERVMGTDFGDAFSGREWSDSFFGGAGDDVLNGAGGNDSMVGGAGRDILRGGTGDDTLRGGGGTDSLFGDEGTDTAAFFGKATDYRVTVDGNGFRVQGATTNDLLSGIEYVSFSEGTRITVAEFKAISDANLPSGAGNDALTAAVRGAQLDGGAGIDTVTATAQGASGVVVSAVHAGTMLGRELGLGGADARTGYTVNDRAASVTIDGKVVAANYWTLFENTTSKGSALLSGTALETTKLLASIAVNVEKFVGTQYDDRFNGRGGADIFVGGAGNDVFAAGGGNDILSGGTGTDTFVIARSAGVDHITDFMAGDVLDLRPFDFASRAAVERLASLDKDGDLQLALGSGSVVVLDGLDLADLGSLTILI